MRCLCGSTWFWQGSVRAVSPLSPRGDPGVPAGIRLHFPSLVRGLTAQSAAKAQLGLGHSYSRAKVKFNVHRVDNMIIQSISLLDQLDKDINTFSMRVRSVGTRLGRLRGLGGLPSPCLPQAAAAAPAACTDRGGTAAPQGPLAGPQGHGMDQGGTIGTVVGWPGDTQSCAGVGVAAVTVSLSLQGMVWVSLPRADQDCA